VEIAVQRAAAFDLMVAASATVMDSLMAIAEQSLLRTRPPRAVGAGSPASVSDRQRDDRLGRESGNAGTRSRLPYRSCNSPNQCG